MTLTMPMPIDGSTQLLAVLGHPIQHSLSPAMHNAALAELGLNWRYLALDVAPARLAEALPGLAAIGCKGLSITIPHKETVAPLLQSLDPGAGQLGAVNALVPDGQGGWHGTNTDWLGFLAPLRGRNFAGGTALVLGSGGVVRAVLRSCAELGITRVVLRGRQLAKLEALAEAVASWAPPLELRSWDEPLDGVLASTQLVVNGTPLGMGQWRHQSPLSTAQLEQLPAGALVYDVVYTPRPTKLLIEAAQRGLATQDGLEMLVQQGAVALGLWTGLGELPVAVMGEAVEQVLRQRQP